MPAAETLLASNPRASGGLPLFRIWVARKQKAFKLRVESTKEAESEKLLSFS
jgi:hypothetical protein